MSSKTRTVNYKDCDVDGCESDAVFDKECNACGCDLCKTHSSHVRIEVHGFHETAYPERWASLCPTCLGVFYGSAVSKMGDAP